MEARVSLVTLVLLLAGCRQAEPQPVLAQDADSPKDMTAELNARKERVKAEIKLLTDKHPWAGAYSRGGGDESLSIALAPEAGFVYEFH